MNTALAAIDQLPDQINQAWSETAEIKFPAEYRQANQITISGMGGSIYNYEVINSVFSQQIKVPLIKVNNYQVPGFLGENSLFIASSYSGTTEEVLFNLKLAQKSQAMCTAITTGDQLAELARQMEIPHYQFEQTHNPSHEPRMGQGYMIFGTIGLLNNLGYFKEKITLDFLNQLSNRLESIHKQAKQMAQQMAGLELLYVASDHLAGNAHILRNQTNETAKLFAGYNLIPELNHHLMEGLKHPEARQKLFIFLNSNLYFSRNQTRIQLTKEVVQKNGYQILEYIPESKTKLSQLVETLIWGGYLTYELGLLYREDPNKIPWVDYFKKKLGKI